MGSGSTAIASLETGRNFLCCERDEKYCEIANTRIEKWNTNQQNNLF
jgi:DNA modification methylase